MDYNQDNKLNLKPECERSIRTVFWLGLCSVKDLLFHDPVVA